MKLTNVPEFYMTLSLKYFHEMGGGHVPDAHAPPRSPAPMDQLILILYSRPIRVRKTGTFARWS